MKNQSNVRKRVCMVCKHLNPVDSIKCVHCGRPLLPTTRAVSDSAPLNLPTQLTSIADSRQGTVSLYIQGRSLPIRVDNQSHIVLGRRSSPDDTFVTVDLTPVDGHPLGVSRRHAVIRLVGETVVIKDLGSSNGTYVNNTRLLPGQQYSLRSGDELRLGKLSLRFVYYLQKPSEDE